ncbi:hypothetical protein UFOVP606_28 [uncultured Caudovirales phage]|uniref:Uncharacterized protein n=1 Tax=uncultured Caudovirales phage TaxID=2100421 RepID=A0A6J5N6I6_9CAUD|nr:hypothetical protein UFOVP606_28 [uncultured Caudovirales phage]
MKTNEKHRIALMDLAEYETELTILISELLECTYSDAAGILEAKQQQVNKLYVDFESLENAAMYLTSGSPAIWGLEFYSKWRNEWLTFKIQPTSEDVKRYEEYDYQLRAIKLI